ncbi:MAG: hypothetical protein V9G04_13990 [Nocardioides sp.]
MKRTLVALAVVLALAGCSNSGGSNDVGDPPPAEATTQPQESPDTNAVEFKGPNEGQLNSRCAMPTAEFLTNNATYAFEGTVLDITDGQVTLEVAQWYRGDGADLVHITAPSADLQALISAVKFEQGKQYLVAVGDGDTVLPCGLSAPSTKKQRKMFVDAFGG